ncbi:MAG: bifunctional riboflavin kinase/FAD synthetase [Gammaproteobacteria bacterium]
MKLIRNKITNASKQLSIVTIGNFDGLHRGHRVLIDRTTKLAKKITAQSVVITFDPMPQEVFKPELAPMRLTNTREKLTILREWGVDVVWMFPFNKETASLTAEQFAERVFVEALSTHTVILGDDFRFGKGREGDFAWLKTFGDEHGFDVFASETLAHDDVRVSSSRVREALNQSDFDLAETLLGRPYQNSGRVAHGERLGRELGFPTANIRLKRLTPPVQGVYVVKVHGLGDKPLPGVANAGTRPAVGGEEFLLEVHLFDFDREIYGKHITVEYCHKLRDEWDFPDMVSLKQQIQRDCDAARAFF